MHQLVSESISLPLLLCYPSKLFPVITPHARSTVIPWNAKWKAYQLVWESFFMQARCEAGALQLTRLLHLRVWVAQVPLAGRSLPLSTWLFLFPAQHAGSLWEIGGVHDEGTHRMCEIINLSPPLESQRGTAPVGRLWMRCWALAQGCLLSPGWGHQAAWGTNTGNTGIKITSESVSLSLGIGLFCHCDSEDQIINKSCQMDVSRLY